MTFSILAHDEKTGTFGAAAATGSLCVGGWVLRGSLEGGLVASQGTAPSTLWRDQVIARMAQGQPAENAVNLAVSPDPGRAHRQIIALDRTGSTGGFTGAESVPWAGHQHAPGLACAGNMLAGLPVLDALAHAFGAGSGAMADRLIAALTGAHHAGGDSRGLQSAALLVLTPDAPPLDLRIDAHDDPLTALQTLLTRARTGPYADWLGEVPVATDPTRAPRTLEQSSRVSP
ncbi:MAG: DUF1028 domain-containing protein [Pseudomonadota bacterium]